MELDVDLFDGGNQLAVPFVEPQDLEKHAGRMGNNMQTPLVTGYPICQAGNKSWHPTQDKKYIPDEWMPTGKVRT
jgi:hypothetical protein